MSFFGPPPEPPGGMPMELPKWGPPLWDRAAEDTLGISVGISVVLAVTDDHATVFDKACHSDICSARAVARGSQHRQDSRYWCFRLPSPGQMTIRADWPDHFDEVAIEVDATPILDAASRSRILWERT